MVDEMDFYVGHGNDLLKEMNPMANFFLVQLLLHSASGIFASMTTPSTSISYRSIPDPTARHHELLLQAPTLLSLLRVNQPD